MSLYNLIHGENPLAVVLLAMLDLDRTKVPRYRDCYWTGAEIAIHTRTGGGNRDFYEDEDSCRSNYPEYFTEADNPAGPWNSDLRALPTYLRDEDDDFDATYATFYFGVPPAFRSFVPLLVAEDATPAQRWQSFLGRIKEGKDDPQVARVAEAMKPLFEQFAQQLGTETTPPSPGE